LASIIKKRLSVHRNLTKQREESDALKLQISKLQALANIGTTTCMIAHEINNLLTPLSSYAELALNNLDDNGLTEKALSKTFRNCGRASKIMESILAVVNGESQKKKESVLLVLVEEIFSCLCRDFTRDSITVNIEIPDDLTVCGVPVEIQQVLMNLILNARNAMLPGGGVLTIKGRQTDETVQIEVSDTGVGIEQDDLEKIFEPFYTRKRDKKLPGQTCGSGLGLAFCRKVVESHDGSLSVASEPAKGASFIITLPKQQKGSD
jgi:signal transduction histidine kinase